MQVGVSSGGAPAHACEYYYNEMMYKEYKPLEKIRKQYCV